MKKLIKYTAAILAGGICGSIILWKQMERTLVRWRELSEKHLALFDTAMKWLEWKHYGKNITDYCIKYGYYKIAVYGMGALGKQLVDELKDTKVQVVLTLDQSNLEDCSEELRQVDIVIITPVTFYDEISKDLVRIAGRDLEMVALDELLYQEWEV